MSVSKENLRIVVKSALTALAEKYQVEPVEIVNGMNAGNENLTSGFAKLVKIGMNLYSEKL